MKNSETLGYMGYYLERGGVGLRAMTEALMRPPEYKLTEAEQKEARDFANESLHHMPVETGDGHTKTLEQIFLDKGIPQSGVVFAAAFIEKNRDEKVDGLGIDIPFMQTNEEVYAWLASAIDAQTISDDVLKKISKLSLDRYKAIMADVLLNDTPNNMIDPTDLDMSSMSFDPELKLASAAELRTARAQLLALRRTYGDSEHMQPIDGAKRALIDIYLAKLNASIVSTIDGLISIYEQAARTQNTSLMERSREAMGRFGCIVSADTQTRQRMMTRFDYMRNGMGINADKKADAISADLEEVTREVAVERGEGYFTPEQTLVLKNTPISVERMLSGFTHILAMAGELSAEDTSTWNTKRQTRAGDKKFQVVEQPTSTTFAVAGTSGVYKVANAPRSLYDVLAVGGFHELCHIDQCLADDAFAEQYEIGKLQGKRTGALREPAANAMQRMAESYLFGRAKPIASPTYLRASRALQAGGTLADAARAFFDAKLVSTDASRSDAATEAADRVLRLMRFHGFNSEPLSYAEGGVIAKELERADPEVVKRAGAITSIDLVDQLKLHKYGLLPPIDNVQHDWTRYVMEEFTPDIVEALRAAGVPADLAKASHSEETRAKIELSEN